MKDIKIAIYPKPYDHTAESIDKACGLNLEELDYVKDWVKEHSNVTRTSELIQVIEGLSLPVRVKLVLVYLFTQEILTTAGGDGCQDPEAVLEGILKSLKGGPVKEN